MLPFPRNISPVPIFYIFLRYWFMIVIRALMFLMPETVPSVCSLNTDSDFTLEGFNNDLRHTFSYFWFSEFEHLKIKASKSLFRQSKKRIQTGFLNTPPLLSAIGRLNRQPRPQTHAIGWATVAMLGWPECLKKMENCFWKRHRDKVFSLFMWNKSGFFFIAVSTNKAGIGESALT